MHVYRYTTAQRLLPGETPTCPDCGEPMTRVADNDEEDESNVEWDA